MFAVLIHIFHHGRNGNTVAVHIVVCETFGNFVYFARYKIFGEYGFFRKHRRAALGYRDLIIHGHTLPRIIGCRIRNRPRPFRRRHKHAVFHVRLYTAARRRNRHVRLTYAARYRIIRNGDLFPVIRRRHPVVIHGKIYRNVPGGHRDNRYRFDRLIARCVFCGIFDRIPCFKRGDETSVRYALVYPVARIIPVHVYGHRNIPVYRIVCRSAEQRIRLAYNRIRNVLSVFPRVDLDAGLRFIVITFGSQVIASDKIGDDKVEHLFLIRFGLDRYIRLAQSKTVPQIGIEIRIVQIGHAVVRCIIRIGNMYAALRIIQTQVKHVFAQRCVIERTEQRTFILDRPVIVCCMQYGRIVLEFDARKRLESCACRDINALLIVCRRTRHGRRGSGVDLCGDRNIIGRIRRVGEYDAEPLYIRLTQNLGRNDHRQKFVKRGSVAHVDRMFECERFAHSQRNFQTRNRAGRNASVIFVGKTGDVFGAGTPARKRVKRSVNIKLTAQRIGLSAQFGRIDRLVFSQAIERDLFFFNNVAARIFNEYGRCGTVVSHGDRSFGQRKLPALRVFFFKFISKRKFRRRRTVRRIRKNDRETNAQT